MNIISIISGPHDTTAAVFKDYKIQTALQKERITRRKGDGRFSSELVAEVLDIANMNAADIDVVALSIGSLFPVKYLKSCGVFGKLRMKLMALEHDKQKDLSYFVRKVKDQSPELAFDKQRFLRDFGFKPDTEIFFFNHHFSHALSAFFYTDWDEALIYTADGGGDNIFYSAHMFKDGELTTLNGEAVDLNAPVDINSLGLAYGYCTRILGFKMNRHEGKLTGLAAYGQPSLYDKLAAHFKILDDGQVASDFTSYGQMEECLQEICAGAPKEDVAASIQKLLEDFVTGSVQKYIEKTGIKKLALAGGVFANVRLNKKLRDDLKLEEIFIFPAMGDEGLAVGGILEYLLKRDGIKTFAQNRVRLENVYLGRDYGDMIDACLGGNDNIEKIEGSNIDLVSDWLAEGKVGAIYSKNMEFGPRALGARSIIATPANNNINQSLNDRLERTEFMPFAPYVLEEDAEDVFAIDGSNRYACRFMTITTDVADKWKDKIPAVVHVDGTARPQIVYDNDNKLYADILRSFKQKTGLPVLVNTSFNVHEEPIINRPEECLTALLNNRVDFIVTENGVYRKVS